MANPIASGALPAAGFRARIYDPMSTGPDERATQVTSLLHAIGTGDEAARD